jgi:NAD(P)-dependent dehydrogenase (short-subunit alcohol dehydrogenase family)
MSESRILRGKKIVVVGGGGLLGARICGDLASNGATVMIADQSLERAEAVAKKIEVSEGKFVPVVDVSITDESSVDRMIARCHEMADGIDALVNTAYPRNPHYGRKFEFVTYHDFCENVNLHLGGYFLISEDTAVLLRSWRRLSGQYVVRVRHDRAAIRSISGNPDDHAGRILRN